MKLDIRCEKQFEDWFQSQYGPRTQPWPLVNVITDDDLRASVNTGAFAASELNARMIWDARRQSALDAWAANNSGVGE